MKLSFALSSFLILFAGGVWGEINSIEQRMLSYFYSLEHKASSNSELDATTYNTLGISYLNGFYQLNNEGSMYMVEIKVSPSKACKYFKESHKLGDKLGGGLLGMLHLNGLGCKEDVNLAKELLYPVRLDYSDTASAYGLTMHKLMRKDSGYIKDENIFQMLESLKYGAKNNQIPALNALYQIYEEGTFVKKDINLSQEYRSKAKILINEKIKLNQAIEDSQKKINSLTKTMHDQSKVANRNKFLFSLGMLATTLYYSQASIPNSNTCTIGCSPPSAVDLLNWGIL